MNKDEALKLALELERLAAALRERLAEGKHITDGQPCWCGPEVIEVDPITGASVVVHKDDTAHHAEQLARLGWQYFECPACGSEGARAFPVSSPIYVAEVDMPDPEDSPGYTELAQPEPEPSELDIWKSRALQAEAVIEKFMAHQQEPVAITITGKLGNIYSFTGDYSLKKGDKVYTTPPSNSMNSIKSSNTLDAQRTWVGLTDEEVITMSRYDLEYAALIGEVERKLKEKNT